MPWLLIVLGAVIAAILLRAWALDRRAARNGQVWIPLREKRGFRSRTRMVLVDRNEADTALAARLHEEQQRERDVRRHGNS